MTIAELKAQREKLLGKLTEASSVSFGDRSVSNRSIAEIKEALEVLNAEIAAAEAQASGNSSRFTLAQFRQSQ